MGHRRPGRRRQPGLPRPLRAHRGRYGRRRRPTRTSSPRAADPFDPDSDDDGLLDGEEWNLNADGDALIDPLDDDDGILTGFEVNFTFDFDGDGTPNHETDSDDDGLEDSVTGIWDQDADESQLPRPGQR